MPTPTVRARPACERGDLCFIPKGAPLIAVDAGARVALKAGLRPSLAVGDWDRPRQRPPASARAQDPACQMPPTDKDRSDTHHALQAARARARARSWRSASRAGATDHHLATLLELAEAAHSFDGVTALGADAEYHFITQKKGVGGAAPRPRGRRYPPLRRERPLRRGQRCAAKYPRYVRDRLRLSSHGLSNEFTRTP